MFEYPPELSSLPEVTTLAISSAKLFIWAETMQTIVNAGVRSVWLDELELRGGINFELEARQRRVLEANERVLIVKDSVAFAVMFPHLRGQVLGSFRGRLSNGGEELRLIADGELVQRVVYDDQWYPQSDGEGFTLAANLSEGLDLDWSVADSWRLTNTRFGTPASESTTTDQDGDRIPDLWELDHGLNPMDASDAGAKVPDLGLTWFEVWTDEGYGGAGRVLVGNLEDDAGSLFGWQRRLYDQVRQPTAKTARPQTRGNEVP